MRVADAIVRQVVKHLPNIIGFLSKEKSALPKQGRSQSLRRSDRQILS